jgi:hypothetical protein
VRVVDASVLAAFTRKEPGWERLAGVVKMCNCGSSCEGGVKHDKEGLPC